MSNAAVMSHGPNVQEQRARIMQALVEVLAERGFANATVGVVVKRAKVSTRTFYHLFDGLEQGLIAIMDSVLENAATQVSRELEQADCWQDGVRSALAAVLAYFDRDPELARVCIVEALAGGPVVLEHRERLVEVFRWTVLQRVEREIGEVSPLAAEGVVSSVLGIMHAHIVTAKPGPFVALLGPLLGLIMAPHLGAWGVEAEIEQGEKLARAILADDPSRTETTQAPGQQPTRHGEQRVALPATLRSPNSRRARECLLFLAEHPGSSNREAALGIDVVHQSHI